MHSQGPWKATFFSTIVGRGTKKGWAITELCGTKIGEVEYRKGVPHLSVEQQESNAKLFAAAAQMFSLLNESREGISSNWQARRDEVLRQLEPELVDPAWRR